MRVKDSLRLVIVETRGKEAAELLPLCDDSPRPAGRWTARDNLAHLAAWRDYAARVLTSVRTGEDLPPWSDDFEEQNARIYEATKDLPARAVEAEAGRSWEALGGAIEACSEEDLHRPRPGRAGHEAWEVVPGNAHAHLAEHLGYWYAEHGDGAAGEAAAIWAHDLDNHAFPEDADRANAAYNLGCFFARHGRAADALPHLRQGLELNPEMADWARKDTDLNPVRHDPQIAALLR